jgi:purine-nucleoside phosphorylase
VQLTDVVLAMAASTDSAMNERRFPGTFAPTASFALLERAHALGKERGARLHVGNVLTSDTFYSEDASWWSSWAAHGVLAAEMETAALYTLAARFGARALSLLAVSDHVVRGESVSAEQRQGLLGATIELALDVAAELG